MLDVDGVLVRGRPADGKPWFTGLEADLGLSYRLLRETFFEPYWQAIFTGHDALRPRLAAVLAKVAPGVGADALIAYWFENDSRLDPAVLEDMATLRRDGVRVLLATNQEHLRARYLMEELGLAGRVDGMLHSAALGCRKPMRDFFRRATEHAGVPPGEIVLVDDAVANVEAAREAGWHAHLWTGETRLKALVG
jgi:putative hydrolase of the HAD superfamily